MISVDHTGLHRGSSGLWHPPQVFIDPAYPPDCDIRELTITVRAAIGDEMLNKRVVPAIAEFCAASLDGRAGHYAEQDYLASNGVVVRVVARSVDAAGVQA